MIHWDEEAIRLEPKIRKYQPTPEDEKAIRRWVELHLLEQIEEDLIDKYKRGEFPTAL